MLKNFRNATRRMFGLKKKPKKLINEQLERSV
jgi:hypothetical protein